MYRMVNPLMVKAALNLMGLPGGALRPPLSLPADDGIDELRRVMTESGVFERSREWTDGAVPAAR